jgi:hypothetical protein
MATDEEIEFASLFSSSRYGAKAKTEKRLQAERRAAMSDKQHSRGGRARNVQMNFRSTQAFKEFTTGLAKHLDVSVADVIEEAVRAYAKAKKFGGDDA